MGKGDRKSRKGKIFKGSYGVVRPKKSTIKAFVPTKKKEVKKEVVEEKPATVKKKVVAKKKAAPKKEAAPKAKAPKAAAPKATAPKAKAPKAAAPKAEDLSKKTVSELKDLAKAKGITGISAMKKADLIAALNA